MKKNEFLQSVTKQLVFWLATDAIVKDDPVSLFIDDIKGDDRVVIEYQRETGYVKIHRLRPNAGGNEFYKEIRLIAREPACIANNAKHVGFQVANISQSYIKRKWTCVTRSVFESLIFQICKGVPVTFYYQDRQFVGLADNDVFLSHS